MRDIIELISTVNENLPAMRRREEICNLLLQELQTLKGMDLAPYLSEIVFDAVEPGTRITLKFPVGAQVFDSSSDVVIDINIVTHQIAELLQEQIAKNHG